MTNTIKVCLCLVIFHLLIVKVSPHNLNPKNKYSEKRDIFKIRLITTNDIYIYISFLNKRITHHNKIGVVLLLLLQWGQCEDFF